MVDYDVIRILIEFVNGVVIFFGGGVGGGVFVGVEIDGYSIGIKIIE